MSGFNAPNHTQVPNSFFDMMSDMTDAELRVTLCAIRKTLGWHKDRDAISLTQFQKMTGLSRQGALNGVRRAIKRGTLKKLGRGERNATEYQLIIVEPDEEAVKTVDWSTQLTNASQHSRPSLVNTVDTQKKVNKDKENIADKPHDTMPDGSKEQPSPPSRDTLFDGIALLCFGLDTTSDDPAMKLAIKGSGGRIGKIKKYLIAADCTAEELTRFGYWYKREYPDVSAPRDTGKFAEHFARFRQVMESRTVSAEQTEQQKIQAIGENHIYNILTGKASA